jgi:UDP-N-acetylglucosamine 2-epimerase
MPEEHNRILTDHCADLLFCPTQTSVNNLAEEGITKGVHLVGDPMYDAVLLFSKISETHSTLLASLNISSKDYCLVTIHRPTNTDNPENLEEIFMAFRELDENIIFPVHPRTRDKIVDLIDDLDQFIPKLRLIEPISYLDMLSLEKNAKAIITDSGGIQKEAYWLRTPCVTLREETEWVETVDAGWNTLVGANREKILSAVRDWIAPDKKEIIFGDGKVAQRIAVLIE